MTSTFVIDPPETTPRARLSLPVWPIASASVVDGMGQPVNPAHLLIDARLGTIRHIAGQPFTAHPYTVTVTS